MVPNPPPYERFAQAQPAGSASNTLVLVGDELIEVTPVNPELIQSSYDLARSMDARFFFRVVRNHVDHRWDLDGYDTLAAPLYSKRKAGAVIEPVRRFPSKDAAVMWAIHRRNRLCS